MKHPPLSLLTVDASAELRRCEAEGRAYLNADRIPEALEAFNRILGEYPDDADTHRWLGNCYMATGDAATALRYYSQALALDPEDCSTARCVRLAQARLHPASTPNDIQARLRLPPDRLALPPLPPHRPSSQPGTPLAPAPIAESGGSASPPLRSSDKANRWAPMASASFEKIPVAQPRAQAVYVLSLEVFFNARHFVVVQGKAGLIHAHSFRVTVRIRHAAIRPGQEYVLGFATARELVQSETNQLNDTLLNSLEPYRDNPRLQPTTESLATVVFQRLHRKMPVELHLESVTVWESPTNSVTYQEEIP